MQNFLNLVIKMKNKSDWKPSLYNVDKNGELVVSEAFKASGSYTMLTLQAKVFSYVIKKYAKGSLLDLGCGNIPLYEFYKNYISDNYCVDWLNTLHKNDFLDLETDITKPLPIEKETFDTILSTQVLEHIYNPSEFFAECKRLLKPNGVLIVSSNFSYWEHECPYDYLRHTQFFFKRIAEENGFEMLETLPLGDGLAVIADIAEKIFYKTNFGQKLPFKILYKLTKYLFENYNLKKDKKILKNQTLAYCCVMKKANAVTVINKGE